MPFFCFRPDVKPFALFIFLSALCVPLTIHAFDNDGYTDILWHHRTRGESGVWLMKTTNFISAAWLTNDFGPAWLLSTSADFNRDGETDLFFRNPTTGANSICLMNGTNRTAKLMLPTNSPPARIVGVGDFNGDGYADLVWHNPATQRISAWLMRGTNWLGKTLPLPLDPKLNPIQVTDLDNDGQSEIVCRELDSSRYWVWSQENTSSPVLLPDQPDPGYALAATGSFNLTGHTDFLWRHTNGHNLVWRMRGTEKIAEIPIQSEPNPDWVIAGTSKSKLNSFLTASVENATNLVLSWNGSSLPVTIKRRPLSAPAWSILATNYLPVRFTNSDLVIGQRYEFQISNQLLTAAIAAAPVEDRGRLLLIIEQSLAKSLAREIDVFENDLAGDGWSVARFLAPRHNDRQPSRNALSVQSVKSFILSQARPGQPGTILLLGHVSIPYSAFSSPDGHGGRALPADIYYGDLDGLYTDHTVDFASAIDPPERRHDNRPHDGKWDQSRLPSNSSGLAQLELAVSRIDFAHLSGPGRDQELVWLRRYLAKNHAYRHKQLVFSNRVIAGSYFYQGPAPGIYAEALRNGKRWLGPDPNNVVEGDFFLERTPALWAFHGGWGLSYGIQGTSGQYHTSSDALRRATTSGPKTAFVSLFGSYFLDWHYTNNLMRTLLTLPQAGLGAMWFMPHEPRINLAFESLALGEPIASGLVQAANRTAAADGLPMFFSFLGDASLRLQILAPPSKLSVSGKNQRVLSWIPSPESSQYFVYRSGNLSGPWERLTPFPISETKFLDKTPPNEPTIYQVRSLQLVHTGSGSFTNLSQGTFSAPTRGQPLR